MDKPRFCNKSNYGVELLWLKQDYVHRTKSKAGDFILWLALICLLNTVRHNINKD